ncbi:hypothetical protein AVEN_62893-1, partial [Araneus ventricosus]
GPQPQPIPVDGAAIASGVRELKLPRTRRDNEAVWTTLVWFQDHVHSGTPTANPLLTCGTQSKRGGTRIDPRTRDETTLTI